MSVPARPFFTPKIDDEPSHRPLNELAYWSIITAHGLAAAEGIKLSTQHFDVLEWLRKDYDTRHPSRYDALIQRLDAVFANLGGLLYIYRLFPQGLSQALKIAGLPVQPCMAAQRDSMH